MPEVQGWLLLGWVSTCSSSFVDLSYCTRWRWIFHNWNYRCLLNRCLLPYITGSFIILRAEYDASLCDRNVSLVFIFSHYLMELFSLDLFSLSNGTLFAAWSSDGILQHQWSAVDCACSRMCDGWFWTFRSGTFNYSILSNELLRYGPNWYFRLSKLRMEWYCTFSTFWHM